MSEKLSPFEITDKINTKTWDDLNSLVEEYNPYIINKIFSNTSDSVLFANEMNRCWGLPKEMQLAFYAHGLPKKKRYGKWHKNQDDKQSLELIQEYFGYSRRKAKDVLTLLRPHLDDIAQELEKGGRRGKTKSD